MKLLRISLVRALAAVVVGVLLLKYDEAVLKGLTIALGVLFLIAGAVSLVGWVNARRKKPDFRAYGDSTLPAEAENTQSAQSIFPIAGLGSLLLGLILAFTRSDDYIAWAMYLVGAVLVLGALNQAMNLLAARKMEPVGFWMWLPPLAIVVASVVAMLKGLVPAETCTTILGVTALVYALVEVVYMFIFSGIKKRYEKTQAQVSRASEAKPGNAAEVVDVEEVRRQ